MKLALAIFGMITIGAFSQAQAAAYGSAGCGLGSMVFDADEEMTQIFAATTNGTFGTQTFGITSGTSNCETGGHAALDVERFVAGNRNALENDVARGQGETLSTFSAMLGCDDATKVGDELKPQYGRIFDSSASDAQVGAELVNSLRGTQASCRHIG